MTMKPPGVATARLTAASLMAGVALAAAGGCVAFDTPENYNRHRLSDVTEARNQPGMFYFDVSVTGEFPEDSAAAETERMKWLEEYLKIRQVCPNGYDILERRHFSEMEDNPAHRDLRYEFRCKPAPAANASK